MEELFNKWKSREQSYQDPVSKYLLARATMAADKMDLQVWCSLDGRCVVLSPVFITHIYICVLVPSSFFSLFAGLGAEPKVLSTVGKPQPSQSPSVIRLKSSLDCQ